MDAEFTLKWSQSSFQSTNHARGDARGMPIHSHHAAERLKPEWVRQPAQKFVAPVLVNN